MGDAAHVLCRYCLANTTKLGEDGDNCERMQRVRCDDFRGLLTKHVMFGERGYDGCIFNGKRRYWIHCVVEDMVKARITRDGCATKAVEKAEWFAVVEEGANKT